MNTAAGQGGLKPLRDLIEPKAKKPETVLTLENAISDPLSTVEAFELPPSIKRQFELVLDSVAEGRGRAFWVQSEYGGGKTHFISALTALLGQSPQGDEFDSRVWSSVNDEDTRSRAHQFVPRRILPVAISCKGILPIDGQYSRALLNLLMEGFSRALSARGLSDRVPVTSHEALVANFASLPEELRQQIDAWCRAQFGYSVTQLNESEGPEKAAQAYLKWCQDVARADPRVDVKVVDWLFNLCIRLQAEGFDGLLVVVDEFATLQNLAVSGPDVAAYEDILESLGWLVPRRCAERDIPFSVYTIVASQKGNPTKLDERFTSLLLLAREAARDYEIIVSRRVRSLRKDRIPELDQYYHRHKMSHDTYAGMEIERFREVFPFQPRVFDSIWSITAQGGDVAAARFGITAVWDVLQRPGILDQTRLLTVSDLLGSEQFQNDLLASPSYRDAFAAYQAAGQSVPSLGFTADNLVLAQQVLDALFVDYLAHHRSPRYLSTREIAEAVLADSSLAMFIPPADQVLSILGRLRQLNQVEYDPAEGAIFKPDAGDGPLPTEIVRGKENEISDDDPRLQEVWSDLLQATAPSVGFWSELKLSSPRSHKAVHSRIAYQGTAELRHGVAGGHLAPDLGYASGRHFHVAVLTRPETVAPDTLEDSRIAVVVPGQLSADEIRLCKSYLACKLVLDAPVLMSSTNSVALRQHAEGVRKDAAQRLITGQPRVYRRGEVVSRTAVAFNPDSLFQTTSWKDAMDRIADRLLDAAYDGMDRMLRPVQFRGNSRLDPGADCAKIAASLVGGSTQTADIGAAQNFGPALGLSRQMFPDKLSPDKEHLAIALILSRVDSAGAGGESAERIYEALCGAPYGVPQEVVTLWLLACVRGCVVGQAKRRVEIHLQNNTKARLKGNAPVPRGILTFVNVGSLEWSNSLRGEFLTVQVSQEAPFGDLVEYARHMGNNLRVPTAPEEVVEEEKRLQRVMAEGAAQSARVRGALAALASALAQPLPENVAETLERTERAMTMEGEYDRGQLLAQLRHAYPATTGLHEDWQKVQRWTRVADRGTELLPLRQFVSALSSRLGMTPGRYEMAATKAQIEVLPRIGLPELLALNSATALDSVVQLASQVRDAYQNEYRIHHRDYYREVEILREELAKLQKRAAILERLNRLTCAGPVALQSPEARISRLLSQLGMCHAAGSLEVTVSNGLACREDGCGLDPLAEPPARELKRLAGELEDAIYARVNAVKARAVIAILEQSPEPGLGAFLAAIQAGQMEGLLEVLDDRLIALIDGIFQAARVKVLPAGVLGRVANRYSVIQRKQIDEVTQAFRSELEQAFAEMESRHPGDVIQLQLALGDPR